MISQLEPTRERWSSRVEAAGPLFKWAGGKQRFIWGHQALFPSFEGRYFEPFAGGLSVLFHLARRSSEPFQSYVSDSNLRLVRTYQEIKKDWTRVDDQLRQLEAAYRAATDKSRFYYDVRHAHNRASPSADAARFLFLMRVGWNGVYRVNQRGEFNVPHGVLKEFVTLPTAEELAAVAAVFQHTEIRASSWESTLSGARAGDFVFLDPPYFTEARTQLYDRTRSFGFRDQVRLADALVDLDKRGVDFVLTNSAHPTVQALYVERNLSVTTIRMLRSINSKADKRGSDAELVVQPSSVSNIIGAEAGLRLRMAMRRARVAKENN